MNQPASQKLDMRSQMPKTAQWVDAKRKEFGADHVNACIKRALKGEPGVFYAMESGHVLGTPFPADAPEAKWQTFAVATGCGFAAFLCPPASKELTHGAN